MSTGMGGLIDVYSKLNSGIIPTSVKKGGGYGDSGVDFGVLGLGMLAHGHGASKPVI